MRIKEYLRQRKRITVFQSLMTLLLWSLLIVWMSHLVKPVVLLLLVFFLNIANIVIDYIVRMHTEKVIALLDKML